jgi:phosphatidylserine/phosphatidylglycerophosphate/cardiolipin synthase-like enzyme
MSPGRRRSAADGVGTDRVFIEPAARRQAMLDVIANARQRLVLSLFRCNNPDVLDALAAALGRGVRVEAILTKRANRGKRRLRKLWAALERMGAVVHRYRGAMVYHAKYLVADGQIALVTTLNPTTKCFTRTWDMLLTTTERNVVRSLSTLFALDAAGERVLPRHRISQRLIVGPDAARQRIQRLLSSARRRIDILDHKLSDPDLVSLLRERRAEGIAVSVIGHQPMGGIIPHGKLIIIDGALAVFGSMALSANSLDSRREVSIVADAPDVVTPLYAFYRALVERAGASVSRLPGDRAA